MKHGNYSCFLAILLFVASMSHANCDSCTYDELASTTVNAARLFSDRDDVHRFHYDDVKGLLNFEARRFKAQCSWDFSIVEAVYLSSKKSHALIKIVGGSSDSLEEVDLKTCARAAGSLDIGFVNNISSVGVEVFPYCECTNAEEDECFCTAARVMTVDANCGLRLNEEKSLALTKRELGVGFEQKAAVRRPGKPDARLLK